MHRFPLSLSWRTLRAPGSNNPALLRPLRLLALLGALFALCMPGQAWALNTGSISGTVADVDGFPLPEAVVILNSPQLIGGEQIRQTDMEGRFRFDNLPPGTYTIDVSRAGFRGERLSNIEVLVNRDVRQNFRLEEATEEDEAIEVRARQRAVDTESTAIGQVLDREVLDRIPAGRTYQQVVGLASGVTGSVGGNPEMGGQAYNENTYMLDGVNVTDPVTGTFSMNFNYDAIQQVEVLLGGYEPEYGVSLGGIINLVTETGSNNLEFDTSVYYTNGQWAPRMDGRYSADGFRLAPTGFDSSFQSLQVGAKVSGPVVRDHAFFIFSYQHARSLISNVGIHRPRDFDGHYVLSKLTVQPSADHRFTAMGQLDPSVIDNLQQSSFRVNPEAQQRQAQGGLLGQLRWQWFMSDQLNLDTQGVFQSSYIESSSVPCTHDRSLDYNTCDPGVAENTTDWTTPGRLGSFGAFSSMNYPFYQFDDRYRYQLSSKLSILQVENPIMGHHDFKVGVEGIQTVWQRLYGYKGNAYYVDLNELRYDPETFQNYYWIETSGPIQHRNTGSQWNFFIQDDYKPIPNLTLKYGVRYDNTVMRNDLGEPVVNASLWGPRLYAAWDPFGDQRTQVGGGFGRFNDTGRLSVANFTSVGSFGSKLFLGEYGPFQDAEGRGFLNSQSMVYDVAPRENPNFAHDNLHTPRVDEFIVKLQREVLQDFAMGSNVSYKMTRMLYEPDEVNVVYDEDGSAVIGSRVGDPATRHYRLRTPELAKRDYVQVDVFSRKIMSNRWMAQLTYTYTHSFGSSSQAISGSFVNAPQTQFAYGPLLRDIPHVVKGWAYWELPTDPRTIHLGGSFEYYSGRPFERLYYSEDFDGYGLRIRPRGEYGRLPAWWEASLKVSHEIPVRQGTLLVDVEAQNLFNNRAPVNMGAGTLAAEHRMVVTQRQSPLRLQLGARYQF